MKIGICDIANDVKIERRDIITHEVQFLSVFLGVRPKSRNEI